MDTLIRSHAVRATEAEASIKSEDFWKQMEANRFGIIPLLLVAIACISGLAAAVAVQKSDAALLAVSVSAVLVEVLVIALAPMRAVFRVSAAALFIDLLIFIL
ncbi:MAG: hypothetical protein AB1458_07515 [Bacteroidota bacterium]